MLVALGVAVTVFGLLLISRPFDTATALAWLAGFALVLSGITDTVRAARSPAHRAEALLGIVSVFGGVVLLGWPDVTLQVVAVVVGVCLVVAGLVRVASDLRARRGGERRTASMVLGVVTVVIGVMALIWPSATIAVLAVLFGIQLVFQGVGEIILGLALRPKPQ
jgi:uncharacterized membrane protein HdeD (DUF308 family)